MFCSLANELNTFVQKWPNHLKNMFIYKRCVYQDLKKKIHAFINKNNFIRTTRLKLAKIKEQFKNSDQAKPKNYENFSSRNLTETSNFI